MREPRPVEVVPVEGGRWQASVQTGDGLAIGVGDSIVEALENVEAAYADLVAVPPPAA